MSTRIDGQVGTSIADSDLDSMSRAEPKTQLAGTQQPRARILYADDDPTLRLVVEAILVRQGYSVVTVEDGTLACSALLVGGYDLLVTDHNMPGMSGLELIHKLGQLGLEIPTILVSGSLAESMVEEFRQITRGGSVLAKPFSAQTLIALVEKMLLSRNRGASGQGRERFDLPDASAPVRPTAH